MAGKGAIAWEWAKLHPVASVILGLIAVGSVGAAAVPAEKSAPVAQAVATASATMAPASSSPASASPAGAANVATTAPKSSAAEPAPPKATTPKPAPKPAPPPLLFVADEKDGDSWVASNGTEYRLGLVDAPELNQPCGTEAAAFTRAFLGAGFRANAYTTDTYGRRVAEVFNPAGKSLNVALAASGFGNTTYLEQFRHENPALAARLDAAFAAAPTPACRAPKPAPPQPLIPQPPAPPAPPANDGCHPDYVTCIPIKGNGSGAGSANDLDCPDIGKRVQLRGSADPYRLDADGDGLGCDSYG